MRGVGVVFSRFLEVDIETGVYIGMVIVFFYAVLGGMKGLHTRKLRSTAYWYLLTLFQQSSFQ